MGAVFENEFGWDGIRDFLFIKKINLMDKKKDKLDYIKFLYHKDPVAYNRWKHFCINHGELPDIFGTLDDPIPIDESKL